jgi:hypothetical protein
MQIFFLVWRSRRVVLSSLLLICSLAGRLCHAGGVTIITHGYNSDVNGWITGMADRLPAYYRFPGTNFTTYKLTLTTDGTSYFYTWSRSGSSPTNSDSGEIIVKLDWSQMAGGAAPYDISTRDVATIASSVLLQTNGISDLVGHALVEFPVHLIGHSRGGSLVSEISRRLGTNGVWIDHLTTLDPHPLNNDGNFEPFFPTDASASNIYANVLFADNYWQNLSGGFFDFDGESVHGAYDRHLTTLSGGYQNTSSAAPNHSNVHLWYHSTLDLVTPTTDTEASITATERQTWWVPFEQSGTNTGFEFSLIGGADRLSIDRPLGPGAPAIVDGFNQSWDFGAGVASNRTPLATNNGAWPSLIKLNRTDTNQIAQGQSLSLKLFYQWARPATSNATVTFYLDNDLNAFNTNQTLLKQVTVPGTGTSVNAGVFSVPLDTTNASPGWHSVLAVINAAGRTRYLYAPEYVQVISNVASPTLNITRINSSSFQVGINGLSGETIILQTSSNLISWQSIATNTLATNRWVYTNTPASGITEQFYRAKVAN